MHVSKSWVSACTDLPIFYLISGPTPRFHARMQKTPSPSVWLWPCSRVQYLVVLAFSRKERALSTRNSLREGWHLCCGINSGSRIWSRGDPRNFFRDIADIVKQSWVSEASQYWPASRAHIRALEALAFLTVTYAFSHFSWYFFFKLFNVHLCG